MDLHAMDTCATILGLKSFFCVYILSLYKTCKYNRKIKIFSKILFVNYGTNKD